MFDKQTKIRLWIIHSLNLPSVWHKCQSNPISRQKYPPCQDTTGSMEGPSLLHTEQIHDLHGQVLTVCQIQGGHPIVMNVNNNDVDSVQYGSLLLYKRASVVEIQLCFDTCVVVIKPLGWVLNQAAVTCQRMSAHHDSATFLVAAHVLLVPVQQAADILRWDTSVSWIRQFLVVFFPPSQLSTASDKSPSGQRLRAGTSFQFTWI